MQLHPLVNYIIQTNSKATRRAYFDGQVVWDAAASHHARGGGEVGLGPQPEALDGREPPGQMRGRHRGQHRSKVTHKFTALSPLHSSPQCCPSRKDE